MVKVVTTEVGIRWQGTGALQGARQFFVRFAGCSVRCPIRAVCDQQESLSGVGSTFDVQALVSQALDEVGCNGWIHLTGGEPCDQPEALLEFSVEARRVGLRLHIQTSGTVKVPGEWDWLTVSPKQSPTELVQRRGSELCVVFNPKQFPDVGVLRALYQSTRFLHYYLVPMDSGTPNTQATSAMTELLNVNGMSWRLGIQAHKFWEVP